MASTETGWTKSFPSQVGNYWFHTDDNEPMVIEISGGGIPGGAPVPFRVYEFGMSEDGVSKATFQRTHRHAEFLGPISPSDTEQLMELRRAGERALNWLEWLRNPLDEGDAQSIAEVINQLRAALNRYCGRAERWEGHGSIHDYVSLDDLLNAERERCAKIAETVHADRVFDVDSVLRAEIAAAIRGKD